MNDLKKSQIDRKNLPEHFPTHGHASEFWENLGRAVASFGFLEEVLGKAIFAFSATHNYDPSEIDGAYENWLHKLEKALKDQLWNLIEAYAKEVRNHSECEIENFEKLIDALKAATKWRNIICHSAWHLSDQDGVSVPVFVNKQNEKFETRVDIALLKKIQNEAAQLSCDVIDTVTKMGWQFPGGAGLGKKII